MTSAPSLNRRAACALLALGAAGCAAPPELAGWERRLRGDAVALLGEVHDHEELHALRLAGLARAVEHGWRPAVAMEAFDADAQGAIDAARRDRPRDARRLVERASPRPSGWHWPLYLPAVQLALDHDLPLVAANLPRATAVRLVREDAAAVLGAGRARELGLDRPLDPALHAALRRAVDEGHCGALPAAALDGMARAQAARDALMAERVRRHADRGVALLAGNGHVRRDVGVPRWLADLPRERLASVGFVEAPADEALRSAFDAVVVAPPRRREADPCDRLRGAAP